MTLISYVADGEEGNATNLNRPLREALAALGLDPDDVSSPWLTQAGADALYAALGHNHDERYYTEAEVDASLAGKAALVHNHDDRYYTEAEVDSLVGGAGGDTGGYGGEHAGIADIEVWYAAGAFGATGVTLTNTGAVLRAIPFIAPSRGGTLDRIAFEVTTGVSQNGRLGLYSSKGVNNIYPDALLVDSGDISTTPAAMKAFAVSQALTAGRVYWLALNMSSSVAIRGMAAAAASMLAGYTGAVGGVTQGRIGLQVSPQTYGAMPDPFPAAASFIANTTAPMLFYRFSA